MEQLWFAWKIVLLQYHKHLQYAEINTRCVVICLKNRTFAVSQTSAYQKESYAFKLWFAWKIVLLQYHKHHICNKNNSMNSCDLLEKSYFCSITNIWLMVRNHSIKVVICLKNRTFAVSQTSEAELLLVLGLLWFAWKIVLLQYHKHHGRLHVDQKYGCDLLEKSYFCSITNIKSSHQLWQMVVVICLKNRTFAVSQTSEKCAIVEDFLLWFAWKIVLLQYHKHHVRKNNFNSIRCDLLEKSYFCSITNIWIHNIK